MRPKLIALLAASAIALVGCATAEQAQTVPVEPSPTASASPTSQSVTKKAAVTPAAPALDEGERNFIEFSGMRASHTGIADVVSDKELVEQFNDFCDTGKPLEISKVESLNENLEKTSESTFCDMRD